MNPLLVFQIVAGAITGFALGLVYFRALETNVALYMSGGRGWSGVALHLFRLGAVIVGFLAAALFGAPSLLSCLAGFLVARSWVVRKLGRTG